ncbi:acyltransferase [Niabella sp. CC-SYL272]|uniref:acyltransferase family protein n=1 Tax=Niabella agricola TaxID=2891571 RepID=UPI001F27E12F|nr:acyltransferase [Niabella agricola]MCF3108821.1 acyltransferase [Niabella agricola]
MNYKTLSQRVYMPELDGLRFFAFLLVFIHHTTSFVDVKEISVLHKTGWIGVDLFFALSAYLFTKLLTIEFDRTGVINFKKFYLRRIFRIWPIYILFILLSVSVYMFSGGDLGYSTKIRIIGLLTFTDNIIAAVYGYNPLPFVSHLWTISYEEQFYVFIPFMVLLLMGIATKKRIYVLAISFVVLNIIRLVFIQHHADHPAIWVLPVTHFESILLGMVIGFGGFDRLFKKVNSFILFLIACALLFIISLLPGVETISYSLILLYTLVGVCTSFFLYTALNNIFLKRVLSFKLFVFLGKRSYGLYVYHLLGNAIALYIVKHIRLAPKDPVFTFMYSLGFTIVSAIVSYFLIEKPFLRIKSRFEIIKTRPI